MKITSIDLGATNTRIGYFQYDKEESFYKFATIRTVDGAKLAGWLTRKVLELSPWSNHPDIIVISSFGPIDYRSGAIVEPPNYPARHIPLREEFESTFKNSIILLVNDAVAGVWSEYLGYAINKNIRDLAYVAVGTGIGVGVIIRGTLLLGRRGDSHEAGHIVIDYRSSIECGCGGIGHFEALYREKGKPGSSTLYNILAAGIASIVSCYDPELVALGGGAIIRGLDTRRLASLIADYSFNRRIPIVKLHTYGEKATIYGGMYIGLRPPKQLLELNGW